MKIYHGFKDPRLKKIKRSVAIGIFDGLHRGHELILKKALRAAKRLKARSMVVTFDPHPQKVLSLQKIPLKILMSLEHRLRLFSSMGIEETLVVPFNKKFATISHEVFLNKLLLGKLVMKALSVGRDFRFGRWARGDYRYLTEQARPCGFQLFLTPPLRHRGRIISSTRIRHLIERGDLSHARHLLGRPVSLYGTVVHGRGRGRSVGFPTANLNPHHETLPPAGVYAAMGRLGERSVKSVVHIGERPTFADKEKTVEVHFLDFHGDLYGKDIELLFLGRLRGIRRFASKERLSRQIEADIHKARKLFSR